MKNRRRTYRVAEKIRSIVAYNLLQTTDPRLKLVTITSVVVSSDLRMAKLYWVISGGKERVLKAEEAFEGARSFFRKHMAEELGMKFVPELRFYYDNTLDTVEEVDRLLDKVSRSSDEKRTV